MGFQDSAATSTEIPLMLFSKCEDLQQGRPFEFIPFILIKLKNLIHYSFILNIFYFAYSCTPEAVSEQGSHSIFDCMSLLMCSLYWQDITHWLGISQCFNSETHLAESFLQLLLRCCLLHVGLPYHLMGFLSVI